MQIKSILDTDLYKFTTSYAYMKLYPEAEGIFTFTDRDNTIYTEEFLEDLKMAFINLSTLKLSEDEYKWAVKTIRFIPQCYWEWLKSFSFDFNKINFNLTEDKHLQINVKDKLYKVTLYETPILALVSYCRGLMLGHKAPIKDVIDRLIPKVQLSNMIGLKFAEFGMRRRFSFEVQDAVCDYLKNKSIYCTGTSNVFLAMKYSMKPIGTHPHEWFMFHGAQFGYKQANYLALENWVDVYDGDLGIALSDTYTTDVFLNNFSRKHAKLFDGVRHDSGDPYLFTSKVIKRYKELGIDPTTKTIVFSNALDMPTYKEIADYCHGRIRCSAGIGTNLTNDTGNKPANIVMKLSQCRMNSTKNWENCIKLSDDKGKHTGNLLDIDICKQQCNIKFV